MTFNLFSTTRKKRSLMYGRVARPIQKSFFQILWRLLQSRMDNLSDYVIPFVFFFSIQALSSNIFSFRSLVKTPQISSTSYKLLLIEF